MMIISNLSYLTIYVDDHVINYFNLFTFSCLNNHSILTIILIELNNLSGSMPAEICDLTISGDFKYDTDDVEGCSAP